MLKLNDRDRLTVYANPARDLVVVQGNSGVVYPFYKSSGVNSKSDQTWSPWMGYFDHHPMQKSDPSFKNQIYMVKPITSTLSEETQAIIKKHLGSNAGNFIQRMGNDECLAISCTLGGGDWDKYPLFKEEIMHAESTKQFIRDIRIAGAKDVILPPMPSSKTPVPFEGVKCSGDVLPSHAIMAKSMEGLTAEVAAGYVTNYSVQNKQQFPTTAEVNAFVAPKAEKPSALASAVEISISKPKVVSGTSVEVSSSVGDQALQLEQGRKIRERYLSKLGIIKDQKPENPRPDPDGKGNRPGF